MEPWCGRRLSVALLLLRVRHAPRGVAYAPEELWRVRKLGGGSAVTHGSEEEEKSQRVAGQSELSDALISRRYKQSRIFYMYNGCSVMKTSQEGAHFLPRHRSYKGKQVLLLGTLGGHDRDRDAISYF